MMLALRSPHEAYRKVDFDARVAGADPQQLVALCYEQLIGALGSAIYADEAQDNRLKSQSLTRALSAITALQLGISHDAAVAPAPLSSARWLAYSLARSTRASTSDHTVHELHEHTISREHGRRDLLADRLRQGRVQVDLRPHPGQVVDRPVGVHHRPLGPHGHGGCHQQRRPHDTLHPSTELTHTTPSSRTADPAGSARPGAPVLEVSDLVVAGAQSGIGGESLADEGVERRRGSALGAEGGGAAEDHLDRRQVEISHHRMLGEREDDGDECERRKRVVAGLRLVQGEAGAHARSAELSDNALRPGRVRASAAINATGASVQPSLIASFPRNCESGG